MPIPSSQSIYPTPLRDTEPPVESKSGPTRRNFRGLSKLQAVNLMLQEGKGWLVENGFATAPEIAAAMDNYKVDAKRAAAYCEKFLFDVYRKGQLAEWLQRELDIVLELTQRTKEEDAAKTLGKARMVLGATPAQHAWVLEMLSDACRVLLS